jgi:hypothetical protein
LSGMIRRELREDAEGFVDREEHDRLCATRLQEEQRRLFDEAA